MDSVFIKPNMMTYLNRSSRKAFDYHDGPSIPNVDDILLDEMAFHKSEVLYDCFNGITIDGIKVIKNTQLKERKDRVNTLSKTKFEKLRKELRNEECVWQYEKDWLWNNTNQQYECSTPLLGEYIPEVKKVVLYLKNIEDACANDSIDFSCGVLTTYIHELFHAAHHEAAHNARRPYDTIREIEEAMTEFSTLLFLNEMSSDSSKSPKWKETFNWAEKKIKENKDVLEAFLLTDSVIIFITRNTIIRPIQTMKVIYGLRNTIKWLVPLTRNTVTSSGISKCSILCIPIKTKSYVWNYYVAFCSDNLHHLPV